MSENIKEAELVSRSKSVCDLVVLLNFVIADPEEFAGAPEVMASLRSQGAVASLDFVHEKSDVILHITKMSLNSLKKIANEVLVGGFAGLDKLRMNALDAVHSLHSIKSKGSKRTKEDIVVLHNELTKEIEGMRIANFRLLQAISHSLSCFKNICDAGDENIRVKRTKNSEEIIRSILGMNFPGMSHEHDFSAVSNVLDFKK
ncbi:hypothetical protein ACK3BE_09555 [Pseudomonas mandelii]|uniref:hypothetical protein n=1 Tax=Pseudomonas mandelii TaxID=75612 RepID=UPI00398D13E9